MNFTLLSFSSVLYFSFHYDFEDFVELVGGEAFDVTGAVIEVAPNVSEVNGLQLVVDLFSTFVEDFCFCLL